MADISSVTNRRAITRYRFTDLTGATNSPTMTNANEWYNFTDLLIPAVPSLDAEVGVLYTPSDPVGDEAFTTQWQGPYRARLTARITGGTVAQDTFIGIMQDQTGVWPRTPLAVIPPGNRDVSPGLDTRILTATWQAERVQPNLSPDLPLGTRLQMAIASTQAGEVVAVLSLELEVEHLAIALSGASL